jgi:signal transduction histidine kinase
MRPDSPRDVIAWRGRRCVAALVGEGAGFRRTTGRRLFFALATVVCAFALALIFAFAGLADIQRILDRMAKHEEAMRLSLELETAVRYQYSIQAYGALGENSPFGDYTRARKRATELEREIALRSDDAGELEWLREVERASGELDRIARARTTRASGQSVGGPDSGYSLVSSIEAHLDGEFARQHAATVVLRSEVSAVQRSTLRSVLALFISAAAFALAIGVYISRTVARPLASLQDGAARLSSGDLDGRIEIDRHDEFGALAAQFNSMTDSLKKHQDRLVQSEKLASVGRLAAGVAHELNNPLTVLLGNLLQRRNGEGRLAKGDRVIEREALRCKEIVQDLLEFSRPAGVPDRDPVDMRELCEDVVRSLGELGQLPLPRFDVQGSGTALGDESKLRQILVNLVKNAAEAAGLGGQVRIRVASSAKAVEVAVSDSGPGIPAVARSRIFEPFFSTKPSGTGLGLAVSRAIAVAHGGDIAVCDGSGGGALFALTLPCAATGGPRHVAG